MSVESRLKRWDCAGRDVSMWWGFFVPAGVAAYGGYCLDKNEALFFGDATSWIGTVDGPQAFALGVMWICIALLLHCHFFWGRIRQTWLAAVLGEIAMFIGFAVFFVRAFMV